ncbi:polysaccharide deacetylase family protein [Desulfovirgula thermocuniculi]|uniref:polysaccharide deacetylase family protein n=1 Tax=Desulfovirgula thermocuniculi TaxID=348842 RepID=UPI0004843EBB|nr:polysaccharide deacetylase family protein [Desulfovirgula thermocuniculi]
MTAKETRELIEKGWIFGGHTYDSHRWTESGSWIACPLPGESLDEYRARVWADIQLMKLELGKLGIEVTEFAPPYGDSTPKLEALLREAGIRHFWIQ